MVLFKISEALSKRIQYFASFPQTGVSLRQMVEFGACPGSALGSCSLLRSAAPAPGKNPSQGTLMKAAMFLSDELPIRLAHRVVELDNLPHGLSDMPSVVRVKNWYAESFQELIEFPKPEVPAELKQKLRGSQVKK